MNHDDTVFSLLSIVSYKMTGEQINKAFGNQFDRKHIKDVLPQYVVADLGRVMSTEYYLQFGATEEDKYVLFDVINADHPLETEISQCGFEDVVRHCDFSMIADLPYCQPYDIFTRPLTDHLIISLTYQKDYGMIEESVEICGYLNTKKELVKYDARPTKEEN